MNNSAFEFEWWPGRKVFFMVTQNSEIYHHQKIIKRQKKKFYWVKIIFKAKKLPEKVFQDCQLHPRSQEHLQLWLSLLASIPHHFGNGDLKMDNTCFMFAYNLAVQDRLNRGHVVMISGWKSEGRGLNLSAETRQPLSPGCLKNNYKIFPASVCLSILSLQGVV